MHTKKGGFYNMKPQIYNTAIYCRLSLDDDVRGDSLSIVTQKQMLERYVKEQGWKIYNIFVDDGYSGTNFDRPAFKRMIEEIEQGNINCVITKDLSRLGRNYIQTGYYTECFFPENGVRYIAINDNYDTHNTDNDLAPFKNIINEWYSRDQSKKIKSALKNKALNGRHLSTFAPLGYLKHPDDNGKYIVDNEYAPVIQKMYELSGHGYGEKKLLKWLYNEKILKPSAVLYQRFGVYGHLFEGQPEDSKYKWSLTQIRTILNNEVYLGHTISFKTGLISYKNRKKIRKPKEDWITIKNTHEPIISQEMFDLVRLRKASRQKDVKEKNEPHIFSGIVKCADCGSGMRYNHRIYHGQNGDTDTSHMYCIKYARLGKEECTNHYLNYNEFCKLILISIQKWTKMVSHDEEFLLKKVFSTGNSERNTLLKQYAAEHKKISKRQLELDALFAKLYEDRVTGAISERNYIMLSDKYQAEQAQYENRLIELKTLTSKQEQTIDNTYKWIELIRKYKDIKELDRYTINELIESIYVGQGQTINGERIQKIDINYRFIGNIDKALMI